MMSAQANPLEMHERLHTLDNPFYGERDYTFTFEFCAVEPIWQTHAVDYVSSDLPSPNIWMGESRQDRYLTRQTPGMADERVFSKRECRSFALFCRDGHLHLVLTIWAQDKQGKSLSDGNNRLIATAMRLASGKREILTFTHAQPCVIQLETTAGVSRIKVWNTRDSAQEPFVLDDLGESFKGFFSEFSEFRFNSVPVKLRTGKHSLKLRRVATWRGNDAPQGTQNFRDCLEQKSAALKSFGYRQLPLSTLASYHPLHQDRWSLFGSHTRHSLKKSDVEWRSGQGLHFDLRRNQCSITLQGEVGRGACAHFMLDLLTDAASLSRFITLSAQVDGWATSEPAFATRNLRLKLRRIFEDVQAFDATKTFSPSAFYTDGTLSRITQGLPSKGFAHFNAQLKISSFSEPSKITATMTLLQSALSKDIALNDERREDIGDLTLKMKAPEATLVYRLQLCRRRLTDPQNGTLRHEERVVFQDRQGQDQGAFELSEPSGFFLLSLGDDRKTLNVFFTSPGSTFPASLTACFTYSVAAAQVKGQVIDQAVLTLGVDGDESPGTTVAISQLSLWNSALWQREGLVGGDESPDKDYNVKTLAYLNFSGLFDAVLEQYRLSVRREVEHADADV